MSLHLIIDVSFDISVLHFILTSCQNKLYIHIDTVSRYIYYFLFFYLKSPVLTFINKHRTYYLLTLHIGSSPIHAPFLISIGQIQFSRSNHLPHLLSDDPQPTSEIISITERINAIFFIIEFIFYS